MLQPLLDFPATVFTHKVQLSSHAVPCSVVAEYRVARVVLAAFAIPPFGGSLAIGTACFWAAGKMIEKGKKCNSVQHPDRRKIQPSVMIHDDASWRLNNTVVL